MSLLFVIIWPPIIFAYLCLFVLGFMDNIRGPYFPEIISDLGITDTMASLFFGVPSVVSILGSVISTRLIRNIAPMNGLRIGLLFLSIGMALTSYATTIVGLLSPLCIFGFGLGMVLVFEHVCIDQGATLSTRRRFLAGLHSMYALAALLSPKLASYMHGDWDWRQTFLYTSFFSLAILGLTFLKRAVPYKRPEGKLLPKLNFNTRLRIYYISLIIALYAAVELTLTTRIVLYLRRQFSFTLIEATEYLFYFFGLLLTSRLCYVIFSAPRVKSKTMLYFYYTTTAISYAVGLYYHPIGLVFCGFFMGPCFAEGMNYTAESFPEYSAKAMAIAVTFFGIIVMAMHYIIGLISDYESLSVALFIGPLSLMLAVVLLAFQDRFKRVVGLL